MSGPIEPARPLPGRLPPVQAVQPAPRDRRDDHPDQDASREKRRSDEDETGPGLDADGHVDLRV